MSSFLFNLFSGTKRPILVLLVVIAGTWTPSSLYSAPRKIPTPLASHPGNIFVVGETVVVPVPTNSAGEWRLIDYESNTLRAVSAETDKVELGRLPVGYYELRSGEGTNSSRISFGVLSPLKAPTPMDSPVSMDVGMAWFFPNRPQMEQVASLCTLAGMNRVRDRLMWEEMEPKRGEFVSSNRYDLSAEVQTAAGLQVLQVSHVSASWANPVTKRFPIDLRDIHNFCREMTKRWRGKVVAFEPWNEADIIEFGGHTGSEMASLQKAAYLGMKEGNPNVIGCLNVFAIRRAATLKDFDRNEAWAYFDTFNLHHYEALKNYPSLYADFRAVSAGKPMWVTECSVHVNWTGDERLKELSDADARLQAERLTKTYTLSMYQGPVAVFYFVLPHYSERTLQYGLLRSDLTPRPGYVAAAAVGRLLAGAKPKGRIDLAERKGQAYCFSAEPDGKKSDVLVAWSGEKVKFKMPAKPRGVYDHLGREIKIGGGEIEVDNAPKYIVLDDGAAGKLIAPPKPAKLLTGKPGKIVLQALLPEADTVLKKSGYKILPGQKKTFPVYVYNFGMTKSTGKLSARAPAGWVVKFKPEVAVAPGDRSEVLVEVQAPAELKEGEGVVRFDGDFGGRERPVLSMKFVNE